MLLGPLLALALAAAPSSNGSIALASPGLSYVGLSEKSGDFFADFFASQLSTQGGIRVTTKSEISAVMGFERQRQLLGCADESSSCLAELAGALGVDGLVVGNLAKTQRGGFAVNLKIVAASDARTVAAATGRLSDDEALLDWLTSTAATFAPKVHAAFGKPAASLPMPPPPVAEAPARPEPASASSAAPASAVATSAALPVRSYAWIPAAAGGALLVGGGVSYGLALATKSRLETSPDSFQSAAEVTRTISTGRLQQNLAFGLGGVGLAALAAAGGLYFFGAPAGAPPLALAVDPRGAVAVTFGGSFR